MLTAGSRAALLLAWIACLPHLGRLSDSLRIDAFTGIHAGLCTCAIVLAPSLRRLRAPWIVAIALGSFAALRPLFTAPGQPDAAALLVSLAAVGAASLLALALARRIEQLEAVFGDIALQSTESGAPPLQRGQGEIVRELRRARRYERPLCMVMLSPLRPLEEPALEQLAQELRSGTLERYASAQLARLLADEADGTSLLARHGDRLVWLLAETDRRSAHSAVNRVAEAARRRWNLPLRYGIASFPDEEVTLEGLLERAERELRGPGPLRATERRGPGHGRAETA
jgi:hypothetical protein